MYDDGSAIILWKITKREIYGKSNLRILTILKTNFNT